MGSGLTDSEFCWQDLFGDKAMRTELTNHDRVTGTAASLSSAGWPTHTVGDPFSRLPAQQQSLVRELPSRTGWLHLTTRRNDWWLP